MDGAGKESIVNELLLIDLGGLFWREWFSTRSQIATLGNVLNRVDFLATQYDQVIVCADSPSSWRIERTSGLPKEEQYKANRPTKAPEAVLTLIDTEQRLRDVGYPVAKCQGFEADDVIATLDEQAHYPVFIASDDKDLYQLITETTTQLTRAGVMGPDECKRKFGVWPKQMRDLLALIGDASDNIAGCPKVGPGKAAALLDHFESIDGIKSASRKDLLSLPGIGKAIVDNLETWDPSLALELITLSIDCPVDLHATLKDYVSQKQSDQIAI